MCGICGKLAFDAAQPVDAALIERMADVIAHRGPDGSGRFVAGNVGLGHRRLSIIDPAAGQQPMFNEDGSIVVVYNGEIYNFERLKADLERRGHRFRTHCDTEVVAHLYEELGDDCVTRFEGMFAFALWDSRRRRLLLARDRMGIKPLYYSLTRSGIVFGSEIKSLLEDAEVGRSVDARALDLFMSYRYLPGQETLFSGVSKLAPGHVLTVENGRVECRRYWQLRFEPGGKADFDAAVCGLQEMLSTSVREHLRSDVPVGVLASGGVDSTGVLGLACGQGGEPLHTFTVGFADASFADERAYARIAARRYGTVHHETSFTAQDFQRLLPLYVWHMEEPVCEPPAIALYVVSRLAQQASVKVLLSGEGADEAFGGYPEHRNLALFEALKSALGPGKGMLDWGLRLLALCGSRAAGRYRPLVHRAPGDYYESRTFLSRDGLRPHPYREDFAARLARSLPGRPIQAPGAQRTPAQDVLSLMLDVDTRTWLPNDLLLKADKMTMAASVELRVPFLDHRLLEFAAALPPRFKVRGLQTKRVLKAALEPHVPQAILRRKKAGFPVPYEHWLRHELRDYVRDTLLSSDARCRAFMSGAALRERVQAHERDGHQAKDVFSLLVLELWLQRFAGAAARDSAARPVETTGRRPLAPPLAAT